MIIGNNSTNLIVKYMSILINQTYNNSCDVTNTYKNNIYNDFKVNDECICSNLVGYNFDNQPTIDKLDYCKIDYVGGTVTGIIIDENDITKEDYMNGAISTSTFGDNSILRKKRLFYIVEVSNTCYGRKLKKVYKDYLMNPSAPTTLTEDEIKDLNDNFVYTKTFSQIYPSEPTEHSAEYQAEFEQYSTSKFLTKEINDNDRFFDSEYNVILKDEYFEEDTNVVFNEGDIIYCRKSTMKRIDSLCANIAMYLNSRFPTLIQRDFSINVSTVNNPEAVTELINSDICKYFCSVNTAFNSDKKAFDIDDFTASFILGRTITPYSSMEDIDYVQRLLQDNLFIEYSPNIRGEWDLSLTNTLYDYQKSLNERYSIIKNPDDEDTDYNVVIPTGYFDIITEKYLLKDKELLGEGHNDAYSSI